MAYRQLQREVEREHRVHPYNPGRGLFTMIDRSGPQPSHGSPAPEPEPLVPEVGLVGDHGEEQHEQEADAPGRPAGAVDGVPLGHGLRQ